MQRSLYEVGELWERCESNVAVEHLATAITEDLLMETRPVPIAGEQHDRTAIISCTANEHHQIGGRMVANLFELHGWRGRFLGANAPMPTLCHMIEQQHPHVVGLSPCLYSHLPKLTQALDILTARYPDLPILVGGQAFCRGDHGIVTRYTNTTHLASLDQLMAWMANQR